MPEVPSARIARLTSVRNNLLCLIRARVTQLQYISRELGSAAVTVRRETPRIPATSAHMPPPRRVWEIEHMAVMLDEIGGRLPRTGTRIEFRNQPLPDPNRPRTIHMVGQLIHRTDGRIGTATVWFPASSDVNFHFALSMEGNPVYPGYADVAVEAAQKIIAVLHGNGVFDWTFTPGHYAADLARALPLAWAAGKADKRTNASHLVHNIDSFLHEGMRGRPGYADIMALRAKASDTSVPVSEWLQPGQLVDKVVDLSDSAHYPHPWGTLPVWWGEQVVGRSADRLVWRYAAGPN